MVSPGATVTPPSSVVSDSPGLGGGSATQADEPTVLVSIVTAPLSANTLPETVVPVFKVILVWARILPENEEDVPSVAELPTCHHTLQLPPLMKMTDELIAVISVLSILKMKTALGSP